MASPYPSVWSASLAWTMRFSEASRWAAAWQNGERKGILIRRAWRDANLAGIAFGYRKSGPRSRVKSRGWEIENRKMGRKWYADGLHFTCQQCGRCCTGEPGYVWVSRAELRLIARFLKISEVDTCRNNAHT